MPAEQMAGGGEPDGARRGGPQTGGRPEPHPGQGAGEGRGRAPERPVVPRPARRTGRGEPERRDAPAGAAAEQGAPGARGDHRRLDRIDRSILHLLQQDGRASIRSVAERVHVSRANAYARVAKMMEEGVIRGFTARVDHERAGQGASAYVTLKIVQNSWRTVREQLLKLPGVEHIALVSGEFDVLLLVHTADNRALRELVLHRIQSLPAVLATQTLLVFDETDQVAAPPPDR